LDANLENLTFIGTASIDGTGNRLDNVLTGNDSHNRLYGDIGFVNARQEAEVKIETFPFTKYDTILATIIQVSNDAIQDEKWGLIYTARMALSRARMVVEEKTVNSTPGMVVTVEIKTGKRRFIEYFLSPLLQNEDESLRDR
jgi:hemolysin D